MADITQINVGGTTYDIKDTTKLPKTTYEWNKEFAASSNGAISLGRYNIYDTQLTFDIDSTTTTAMSGKLVIATQNGRICEARVFGDATNTLVPCLQIYQSAITNQRSYIEVFCNFPGWSKNKVHIYGVALNSATVEKQMTSVTITDGVVSSSNITSGDTKWTGTIVNAITSTVAPISHTHSDYQPKDGDLTAIAGLTGTSGLLKKTAANTWALDTNTYLTAVPNIASNKITAMTSYSKPSSTSAISTSDTLNEAIGKLEKALDGKGTSNFTGYTSSNKLSTDYINNKAGWTTNAGTVTSVKVGTASYSPASGVVSLPAYPTSLPASDVSSWAKATSKPTYTASEVGLGNVGNFKAVSTVASQGLTTTEKSNARANIGAGTSSLTLAGSGSASTAAKSDHTHSNYLATTDTEEFSIAIKSGDTAVTNLYAGGTYTLHAGGATCDLKIHDTVAYTRAGGEATYDFYFPLLVKGSTNYDTAASKPIYSSNILVHPNNGQIKATSFQATSDRRLKENIKPYSPTKSILDLPVVEFDFKDSGLHQIGCIAQDLQEICPEIVNEDAEGYLSINESKIVYLLLDEVKKLKAEVEALKQI